MELLNYLGLLKSGFLTQSHKPQQQFNLSHLLFWVEEIIDTMPPIHIEVNATTSIGPVIIYILNNIFFLLLFFYRFI